MSVRVLIPYRRTGELVREQALAFVADWWQLHLPDAPVLICPQPDDHENAGWSKGAALSVAPPADGISIVADADVFLDDPAELYRTLRLVDTGAHGWGMAHELVHRLDQHGSEDAMTGIWDTNPAVLSFSERPYRGVWGGGLVVVRDELLARVPMDPRFRGWGGEDTAWAIALTTTAGRGWRGTARLMHLWHEPQERRSRKRGSVENSALYRRYCLARDDQPAMRALLEEVTTPWLQHS